MTAGSKCGRCGHAEHAKACRAKAPSGCVPFADGATVGMICGARPSCPCAWRSCACGTPVALAVELPPTALSLPLEDVVMLVSVERGSAGAAEGLLAVRELVGGFLACRNLSDGDLPAAGEWRGREHVGDCGMLAKSEDDPRWLTLRL